MPDNRSPMDQYYQPVPTANELPSYRPYQGAGNAPNNNSEKAVLERIEHKLDTILAMLQAGRKD